MNQELSVLSQDIISSLVLTGDVSKLNPTQKVQYYNTLCERIGLDPTTQPFKLLKLQGKEVLYADKGATQQLSKIYDISHQIIESKQIGDIYSVVVRATISNGRFTDEVGAVAISGLKGNDLCNAIMKASTKAKRRAVLAICGLGMLDETEIETIAGAQLVESTKPTLEMPKALNNVETDSKPKIVSETHVSAQSSHVLDGAGSVKTPVEAAPLGIINQKAWDNLTIMAVTNGWAESDIADYVKSLGYKAVKKFTPLNQWDLESCEGFFKVKKSDYTKKMKEI